MSDPLLLFGFDPIELLLVVGVDPGPTPGIVAMTWSQRSKLRAGPAVVVQCNHELVTWLVRRVIEQEQKWQGPPRVRVILALERYVIGARSSRTSHPGAGEITRRMVGALEALGHDLGALVRVRDAMNVKAWGTDLRLRKAGLYEPTNGMRHARDAARHCLFSASQDGGVPDPLSSRGSPP